MVNVVGDHARSHKRLDAPLESDIDAVAGTVSGWVRRSLSPADVAGGRRRGGRGRVDRRPGRSRR